jgi:hypothetical protein
MAVPVTGIADGARMAEVFVSSRITTPFFFATLGEEISDDLKLNSILPLEAGTFECPSKLFIVPQPIPMGGINLFGMKIFSLTTIVNPDWLYLGSIQSQP